MNGRIVFIGLGSNQGDRKASLSLAIEALSRTGLKPVLLSSLYRTDPVEVVDQDEFINQVVGFETVHDAPKILESCLAVEAAMGRIRTRDKGPRRIDLDLLLAGDDVRQGPRLQVPHPRMHLRRFVLVPLTEIAPGALHPVLGKTASEMLAACPDRSRVERVEP